MDYTLVNAKENNISYIKKCKLYSIFEYADDLTKEEEQNIRIYADNDINMNYSKYNLIVNEDDVYGLIYITKKDDGIMIDELYINDDFRNKGIGTKVLKDVLEKNNIVYLWVYKNNHVAYNLYYKLGFVIKDETKNRYYMKYEKYKSFMK